MLSTLFHRLVLFQSFWGRGDGGASTLRTTKVATPAAKLSRESPTPIFQDDSKVSRSCLAFLGESVLAYVTAEWLLSRNLDAGARTLSRKRRALLDRSNLLRIDKQIGSDDSEAETTQQRPPEPRAGVAFASLAGSLYLNFPFETCAGRVMNYLLQDQFVGRASFARPSFSSKVPGILGRLGHAIRLAGGQYISGGHWAWNQLSILAGFPEPRERLHYLGSSLLPLLVSDYLIREYPDLNRSALGRIKSRIQGKKNIEHATACLQNDFELPGAGKPPQEKHFSGKVEIFLGILVFRSGLKTCKKAVAKYLIAPATLPASASLSPPKPGGDWNDKDKREMRRSLQLFSGMQVRDLSLYQQALTHTSFLSATDDRNRCCNERLEHLGDSVLSFIVGDYLYSKYPDVDEGALTEMKTEIVSGENLNRVGESLQIQQMIRFRSSQTPIPMRVIGRALEALICAFYLDLGLEKCRKLVIRQLLSDTDFGSESSGRSNPKGKLMELCHRRGVEALYELEQVQDAPPRFRAQLFIDGKFQAEGLGSTKKGAEQRAARQYIEGGKGEKTND